MVLVNRNSKHAHPTPHSPTEGPSARPRKTLTWAELPAWMQDNKYILSGYRAPTGSFVGCIKTLGFMHNEVGNIVSHLIGALFFVWLSYYTYGSELGRFGTVGARDVAVVYAFLVGAIACMGVSAFYHLVTCHSQGVARMYNKCDYIGIVTLIVGSCVPVITYMFNCNEGLRTAYLALIFALGSATVVMVVSARFATPRFRPIRAATFVALGLTGVVPALHAWHLFGWRHIVEAAQIKFMLAMGAFYILGAVIYGARVPERWAPGRFDYLLHSHQIFHMFVVVAALFHYVGVVRALRWAHTEGLSMCEA